MPGLVASIHTQIPFLNKPNDFNIQDRTILHTNFPLESIEVNYQPLNRIWSTGDELHFSYTENNLAFIFLSDSLYPFNYEFRLTNVDRDWIKLNEDKSATYSNLSPGEYTFKVKVPGNNQLDEAVLSVPIIISSPPWEAASFKFLIALFLTAVLYSLNRYRNYYHSKVEKLRLDIARDLHDDVSSTLSSISFFAHAIVSDELSNKHSQRFLNLISESSQEAKEKISDFIWVIHPQDDDWETLLLKCKRYASDILESRGIDHHFVVEGKPPATLKLPVKKNTWLIFRELITNIARHANPESVIIRFTVKNNEIKLTVNDNGNGFEPEAELTQGHGLKNIMTRVETLKGKVLLDSKSGMGTNWELQLPI